MEKEKSVGKEIVILFTCAFLMCMNKRRVFSRREHMVRNGIAEILVKPGVVQMIKTLFFFASLAEN